MKINTYFYGQTSNIEIYGYTISQNKNKGYKVIVFTSESNKIIGRAKIENTSYWNIQTIEITKNDIQKKILKKIEDKAIEKNIKLV